MRHKPEHEQGETTEDASVSRRDLFRRGGVAAAAAAAASVPVIDSLFDPAGASPATGTRRHSARARYLPEQEFGLGDLVDVDTTDVVTGEVLLFNDTAWMPAALTHGHIADFATEVRQLADQAVGEAAIGALADVDTTGAAAGQVLLFDDVAWTPAALTHDHISDFATEVKQIAAGGGIVIDTPPAGTISTISTKGPDIQDFAIQQGLNTFLWTKPDSAKTVEVWVFGGGGGGGSGSRAGVLGTVTRAGGGGGSGGNWSHLVLSAVECAAQETVIVGAGGAGAAAVASTVVGNGLTGADGGLSSFGPHVCAGGGIGGKGGTTTAGGLGADASGRGMFAGVSGLNGAFGPTPAESAGADFGLLRAGTFSPIGPGGGGGGATSTGATNTAVAGSAGTRGPGWRTTDLTGGAASTLAHQPGSAGKSSTFGGSGGGGGGRGTSMNAGAGGAGGSPGGGGGGGGSGSLGASGPGGAGAPGFVRVIAHR